MTEIIPGIASLMIGGGMISAGAGGVTALMGGDGEMCAAGFFGGAFFIALGYGLMWAAGGLA